tara:strand:- start:119 stop:250 length:132 start_codon:yes stop_codon:yes gene_type:complete
MLSSFHLNKPLAAMRGRIALTFWNGQAVDQLVNITTPNNNVKR